MDNEGKAPYDAFPWCFWMFFSAILNDIHTDSYIVIMFAGCLAMLL